MQTTIKFKLSEEETRAVEEISRGIGMNIHDFCKRAVFYAVNDSYRRAEALQKEIQNGQSAPGDTRGDTAEVFPSEVHTGDAFPHKEDAGAPG